MKKIIYILVLFAQFAWCQTAFEKANTLYQQQKFDQAAKLYESILHSGKESAEVYFNLGNCYYKLKRTAPSIYNYEMALRLAPRDEEIQTNLDFARKMTVDGMAEVPKTGINGLADAFTTLVSADGWAWLAIVFAVVTVTLFAIYYLSKAASKKRRYFGLSCLSFLLMLVGLWAGFHEKSRLESTHEAIIFAPQVTVLSEPQQKAQKVTVIHEGLKVTLLEKIGDWRKIELPDGTLGWVEAPAMRQLM